ncbi:unnamed protein product, partial [marine sediment metagenome]
LSESESSYGRGIKVNATSTPGDAIHTAVSGTSDIDEVYLYAVNAHTAAVTLTIEWGGTTDPDDLIEFTIPHSSGLYVIAPGLPLQNGLDIAAFASTADVISIFGFVNRITA